MDISQYKKYEPFFGSWYIAKFLGKGNFGKVFEIQREDFGETYRAALKIITVPQDESEIRNVKASGLDNASVSEYFADVVKEIVSEFVLMNKLKGNNNVVNYEDHIVVAHEGAFGWDIFIRMELLNPLMDYAENTDLTRKDVIKLGIDMCHALELCQAHNIIHRDIKPENIFMSDSGHFKLGDFGIARTIEKTVSDLSVKGTYAYMAPEVRKGEKYGSNVDIYSLGIVMYRLLNGNRIPFLPPYPEKIGYSDMSTALDRRLSGEKIPAPSGADGRLAEIVLKACAFDSKDRYSSPLQMREELEAIAYESGDVPVIYPQGDVLTVAENEYETDTGGSDSDVTVKVFQDTQKDEPNNQNAPPRYCVKCGTPNTNGANICDTCTAQEQQYQEAARQQQQQQQQYYEAAQRQQQYYEEIQRQQATAAQDSLPKKKIFPLIAAILGGVLIIAIAAFLLALDYNESQNDSPVIAASPAPTPEESPTPMSGETPAPASAPTPQLDAPEYITINNMQLSTSLVELDLSAMALQNEDIVALRYMTNLSSLDLHLNEISDLSPLSTLTNLTELVLWGNQISDISPLRNLKNLRDLDICLNPIDDLSPLSNLANLTSLCLFDIPINDWSPVAHVDDVIGRDIPQGETIERLSVSPGELFDTITNTNDWIRINIDVIDGYSITLERDQDGDLWTLQSQEGDFRLVVPTFSYRNGVVELRHNVPSSWYRFTSATSGTFGENDEYAFTWDIQTDSEHTIESRSFVTQVQSLRGSIQSDHLVVINVEWDAGAGRTRFYRAMDGEWEIGRRAGGNNRIEPHFYFFADGTVEMDLIRAGHQRYLFFPDGTGVYDRAVGSDTGNYEHFRWHYDFLVFN